MLKNTIKVKGVIGSSSLHAYDFRIISAVKSLYILYNQHIVVIENICFVTFCNMQEALVGACSVPSPTWY